MDRINIPQISLGASSVIFLIAFFLGGRNLIFATQALLIASIISAVLCVVFRRQTNFKTWGMLLSVIFFSGLTVYFDNEAFIKWRPTVINAVLCIALLVMYYSKTMPFKYFFAKHLELNIPDSVWLKQNIIWMVYFFISGMINTLLILFNISNEGWIVYKTVIGPILATIFSLIMIAHLYSENKKYKRLSESENHEGSHE